MSKRQVRVPLAKLSSYFNQKVALHIIMKDGSVYLARVIKMNGKDLLVKNAMSHLLTLSLLHIDEIWAEEKVTD